MSDEQYIERCIQLAENARGNTSPNPLVGSVIVHNGQIIGEGWHQKAGEAHAEVNAINSVLNKELLKESTIYVSLEPCAHFGKTPPCSDLIIEHKIPRVVIGCRDPFDAVNGKGIEKLKNAGIDIKVGVKEKECLALNASFFTFHTQKRPYIILKWAQTADGFIDKNRDKKARGINWITQPSTKILVHKWRKEVDAILVGAKTVVNDNPELTTRLWDGKSPIRIIIDPKSSIPQSSKVLYGSVETFILTKTEKTSESNVKYIAIDENESIINAVVTLCYQREIQSILIEGGAFTLQQFIDVQLWDEARVLTGSPSFGAGLKAPNLGMSPTERQAYGEDTLKVYYR